jgi:hypothetical protein
MHSPIIKKFHKPIDGVTAGDRIPDEKTRNLLPSGMTGYGLGDSGVGVRVPVRSKISSTLRHPDRFWGPHSFLPKKSRVLFSRG